MCTHSIATNKIFLHQDSEDSDRTEWMPRFICVQLVQTLYFVERSGSVEERQTLEKEVVGS